MKDLRYICTNCGKHEFELRHHISAIAILCSHCNEPVGAITIGNKFQWVGESKREEIA